MNRAAIRLFVLVVLSALLATNGFGEKFDATWESLEQYECPRWFRDAKFGIFICWNPYTVPAAGDWYARNMYIEGHPQATAVQISRTAPTGSLKLWDIAWPQPVRENQVGTVHRRPVISVLLSELGHQMS